MKTKWIVRAVVGLVVLLLVVFVVLAFSLGAIVKKGVETIGPNATKVDVKLKSAEVWLFGGRAQLTGFILGNPAGCKTPTAVAVDDITVHVQPGSVFGSKLVVETISVKNPVIMLEGGPTDNNLTKIEKNLNDYVGSPATAPATDSTAAPASPAKSERKLQVNDLVISGAKLEVNSYLSGGRTITLPIPDIHVTGLGTGPDGITPVEVGQRALHAVLTAAASALAKNAGDLGKEALSGAKDALKSGNVKKATDGLKGLFK
ncbi:MAG TPA: hypothetical protein VHB20_08415 [Verrucomicrobiae bacterium]|jgi:hypothetical protein|nr:hypothetical protein [Verrucomicrobiae bacterium]